MEFIKNLLYDISDSVIKLLVVAAMVFVIAFKLNTAMPDIDVFGYNANQDQAANQMEQKTDDSNVISIDLTDSSINKSATQTPDQDQANANEQKQITATDQKKPDTADAQSGTQTAGQTDAQANADGQKPDGAADNKKTDQAKPKTEQEIKAEQEAKKKLEAERVTKKIVIESGYTSQKIASVLVNDKVIKDAGAFLDVVAELGYTSKLRSGTYYLSSDMTYEEIANKLVGR